MVASDGITRHGFEMERRLGSNIVQVLSSCAQAWDLNSPIYTMKAEQQYTYAWYIKDGKVSLVLGWIDNPTNVFALREEPKLLVGKLHGDIIKQSSVNFGPVAKFNTLASFSLKSMDVFNEAAEWIDINWQKFTAYS